MKLVDNVREYLDKKCQLLSTGFYVDTITCIEEYGELDKSIESPIEQLFYIEWRFRKFCNKDFLLGIEPQYQDKSTGKYKLDFGVDFIQEAYLLGGEREWDEVVLKTEVPKLGIELDGHVWHEKTKEQVQYHKERERFLIANEWKLLRFTGSEIYENPVKCVSEVLGVANQIAEKYHKELFKKFKERKRNGKSKASK